MKKFLVLILLILNACSKPPGVPIENNISLTKDNILDFFATNGFSGGITLDNNYSIIKKEFLDYDFPKLLMDLYIKEGLLYKKDRFDCDKFTLQSSALMSRLLYNNIENKGVTFGELYYIKKGDLKGHAINFALVLNSSNKIVLEAFEPQLLKPVSLTAQELQSIFFWRL